MKFHNGLHAKSRGVVTLSARCARAHPVFGSDKGKDLCGHTQFFIVKCARERWGTPSFKNVTTSLNSYILWATRWYIIY